MQGELAAARLTEGLPPKTMVVVLSRLKASRCLLQRHKLYASPARGYFSMKKSNQKSLGEDPETPYASESSRPETLRIPGAGLDDADKEPQAHFNLVPANRLQEVTLSSLWVEQAAICPDGPSPATGEG